MATLSLTSKDIKGIKADALVIGVAKGSKGPELVDADALPRGLSDELGRALVPLGVTGAADQVHRVPSGGELTTPVIVLTGLGSPPRRGAGWDDETVRRAAGAATRTLAGCSKVVLALPATDAAGVAAVAEGALLGAYAYARYRAATATEHKAAVGEVVVVTARSRDKAVKAAAARAGVLAEAVAATRDLVNCPPLDLYPASFAEAASDRLKGLPVKVRVLDEKQLAKGGYGGILGVGQGSSRPPRLVTLTYSPSRASKHLALVGKGITFDSGGLSIKPAAAMETMKLDMGGAAAVLQAVAAIAQLSLPIKVTAYLALAENMPSGTAQRPSDVISTYGGRTVEVLNTDAEGRLVMADAIAAASEEHPDLIVDIATLTGAQMIALGNRTSAIMSNDDDLRSQVHAASQRAGEQFWPMPLPEELRKSMDSQVADIANMGERYGGMLVAGLFLREFVGPVRGSDGSRSGRDGEGPGGDGTDPQVRRIPWAHLDIAGPAFNDGAEHGYTGKGGTGVGVRTLLALAEELAS